MTWLTVQKAALICGVTDSAVQKAAHSKRYESCYVEGRGRGGQQLRIALESLPDEAQARYHGEQDEKSADILLALTDAQRDVVFSKLSVVEAYQNFKRAYPKADKLQAFLAQHNENSPDKPLTKRQLNHWERQFNRDGVAGLVDRRGGYNKGQSSIQKDEKEVFLSFWLQEKGTKSGGPSVASCYRLTQRVFPDRQLASVSAFERLARSIPYPTKVLAREGKKAFDDKCMPYMSMDYTKLHTNQQWVADDHVFDVLVEFPDGHVGRPWITGWEDRRSRYIVGYLMSDHDPNANDILDAFARAVSAFGIPEGVLLDNGKNYTVKDLFNKDFTMSIANQMTISVTNAIKYNAKAKHIERFFNTLEYSYMIHLESYIGADPKRRPERMQTVNDKLKGVAMPYAEFIQYVDHVINIYNNSTHSGHGMNSMTPCQAFTNNVTAIKTADPVLLSMYFKRTSKLLKVGRNGVRVPELEQYYDANELFSHQGEYVYARYNTDDVRQVYIVSEDGKFICTAESVDLGCLDEKLTAQNLRKLNAKKKERRKQARAIIPDVAVPGVQQLAIENGLSFTKPNLKMLPTTPTANSEQHKTAQAIQAAQEQHSAQRNKREKSQKKNHEREDAFYKFMTGGGIGNAIGE